MKTITKKGLLMLLTAAVVSTTALAQPHGGNGYGQGPAWDNEDKPARGIENILDDLTEDQKTSLEALRLDHYKEMKDLRNQMGEIRAKQRTIVSKYDMDTDAAGKIIDQKTALMNKQMKMRLAHQAEVRDILTEEQFLKLEQFRQKRQLARKKGRGYHAMNRPAGHFRGNGAHRPGFGPGANGTGRGFGN